MFIKNEDRESKPHIEGIEHKTLTGV